jgi:hypothetical protein
LLKKREGMASVNHHLWRNRKTWWVAFTVLHGGHRQERVRRSLGTVDVTVARARRDDMMREFAKRPDTQLALRGPAVVECVPGGC